MKAKSNITKAQRPEPTQQPAEVKKQRKPKPTFPDNPLTRVDINDLPKITQSEITDYLNAAYHYEIARADYERKRANLAYKLILGARLEDSDMQAQVDKDGRIILTEKCSTCSSNFEPR